jgi:hypothetical protein
MFIRHSADKKRMAVRYKDGKPIPTKYHEPITIVKYVHDVVVVETWFGTFVLSPTSIAYVENKECAVAKIKRDGGKLRLEPQDVAEVTKNTVFGYLPENLPRELRREGDKIYLDEAEVGTIYKL